MDELLHMISALQASSLLKKDYQGFLAYVVYVIENILHLTLVKLVMF